MADTTLLVDLDATAAMRQVLAETTIRAIGRRTVEALAALVKTQNLDVSFSAALETQQVITVLGTWLENLDETWADATLEDLACWKAPDEPA